MFDINAIPQELRDLKQWTYSYSVEDKKRPKHSHYTPNGSLKLVDAIRKAGDFKYVGFYTTRSDPYIMGDIDHVPMPEDPATCLPIAVADLLLNKGLYSERSPSGKGIRFIARLESAKLKEQWEGNVFYIRDFQEGKRENQINFAPPWMTITGDKLPYSSTTIPILTLADLELVYQFGSNKVDQTPVEVDNTQPPPSFEEFKNALFNITLDDNARIKRAAHKIYGSQKTPYDFWLHVLMAAHDYGSRTNLKAEVLAEVIRWSEQDKEAFDGEQSIIDKWFSFDQKRHNTISYHTIFALDYENTLHYPRCKPLTKPQKARGVRRGDPLNTEYVNFRSMVKFYGLKLYQDIHNPAKLYLTGDQDIIDKYFRAMHVSCYYEEYYGVFVEKSLTAAFHIMCQDCGFLGIGHQYVSQHIRNWVYQIAEQIDMVRIYFDTPFNELPESYQDNKNFYSISTSKYMFDCLDLDYLTSDHTKERVLYERYYHCWLLGLARNLYFTSSLHMNNCVLLLTGREQIRKTSHFKFMLPKFMREEQIAFTTHGFDSEQAIRDVSKISASNSLVVWDEVERYLDEKTESNFKMIIDNNPQKVIDKYEVVESIIKPNAIYGATSNKREFKLSDTGSRRLFHIPVKWVDTNKLDTVCWHRIVSDAKEEIKRSPDGAPWLLTKAELMYQDFLHGIITSKTGFELLLDEIFLWGETYPFDDATSTLPRQFNYSSNTHFLTTKQISQMIITHTGGRENPSRPALTRTLKRLCGRWTKSKGTTIYCYKPKLEIQNGLARYGSQRSQKWLVPNVSREYNGVIRT